MVSGLAPRKLGTQPIKSSVPRQTAKRKVVKKKVKGRSYNSIFSKVKKREKR